MPPIAKPRTLSEPKRYWRPTMSVLASQHIRALIESPMPLITGFTDIESQLQPNGFDLSLDAVEKFDGPGQIGASNEQRILPTSSSVPFQSDGFVDLQPGPYLARLTEGVSLPAGVMALARPRSSLLRSGVAIHNAVWDAGYSGRSQVLIVVYNQMGFRLAKGARIVQMVFFGLDTDTESLYAGIYQNEALETQEDK